MKKLFLAFLFILFYVSTAGAECICDKGLDSYVYKVKEGDTLSEIVWFLKGNKGDKNFKKHLIKCNPELGIRRIQPGQEIYFCGSKDIAVVIENGDESIKERIGKAEENIQSSVSEVKKSVDSLNKPKIKEKPLVKAKAKVESNNIIQPVSASFFNKYWKVILIICLITIFLIVFFFTWICKFIVNSKSKKAKKQVSQGSQGRYTDYTEVAITLNGIDFISIPEKTPDGRYVSLYKNTKGDILCYKDIRDYRKSIIKSFHDNPLLIWEEMILSRLSLLMIVNLNEQARYKIDTNSINHYQDKFIYNGKEFDSIYKVCAEIQMRLKADTDFFKNEIKENRITKIIKK